MPGRGMASARTLDHEKISGIKSYLRYKSLEELQGLSDAIFSAATEEVTITGTSSDGGSANGEVTLPKWLYLEAVMDVRKEKGDYPVNADGVTITSRQLGTRPDYSRTWSVT
jgi:hypothetical protein